jgi:DNA-binding winged helix-turn-helix (wHTH) protein
MPSTAAEVFLIILSRVTAYDPPRMPSRLRFGDFELDLAAYALRSGDIAVSLERQPMELLRLLVEARGALVERAQIQAALWNTGVFVDHEAAINTAIRKLRRALGDAPEHPRFIQTVVGKGYRFVAPVHEESPTPARVGYESQRRFPKYSIRRGAEEFALVDGSNLIGRDPDAQVYIDHPSVSRRHALVSIGQSGAVIEDLGSRNGTFVNGRRVEGQAELHQRAVIGAGPIVMTFEVLSEPASTKPMRSSHRVPS